ncbi:MAG: 30S ribosomal protein S4 [bacterium]
MSRYTKAECRLCRREGNKLFLKGERCFSAKCAFTRRGYAPGQHGKGIKRKKDSEYGIRLREKQKARRVYSVCERQFAKYFENASRESGITGEKLLEILERRLDNVIYRLGFADSRNQGRQVVRHGHVAVNGKKVNIPSYQVRVGEVVSVKPKMWEGIKSRQKKTEDKVVPAWLESDLDKGAGKVLSYPQRSQIDTVVDEQMIVEYYSR